VGLNAIPTRYSIGETLSAAYVPDQTYLPDQTHLPDQPYPTYQPC